MSEPFVAKKFFKRYGVSAWTKAMGVDSVEVPELWIFCRQRREGGQFFMILCGLLYIEIF